MPKTTGAPSVREALEDLLYANTARTRAHGGSLAVINAAIAAVEVAETRARLALSSPHAVAGDADLSDGKSRLASSEYSLGHKEGMKLAESWHLSRISDRDLLGEIVRAAWIKWAETQEAPKASWLLPYSELSEPDKEADRQIGEAVIAWAMKYAPSISVLPVSTVTVTREDAIQTRRSEDDCGR